MDSPFEYGDFFPSIHSFFHKCYQWWLYLLITHKRKWWWPSPLLPPVCPAPEGFGRWDPCNSASLRLCPSRSLLPRPGIKVILLYRVRFGASEGVFKSSGLVWWRKWCILEKPSDGKIPHPCPSKYTKLLYICSIKIIGSLYFLKLLIAASDSLIGSPCTVVAVEPAVKMIFLL